VIAFKNIHIIQNGHDESTLPMVKFKENRVGKIIFSTVKNHLEVGVYYHIVINFYPSCWDKFDMHFDDILCCLSLCTLAAQKIANGMT
jgi:hypothetical protein